jgi:hypothetical protein
MKVIRPLSLVLLLAMTAGIARSAQHEIYSDLAQAKADMAAAAHAAAQSQKRVPVIFGGNFSQTVEAVNI